MKPVKDQYKILGVSPSATVEEIKRSFRAKAKRFHPDRNPGDQGEERFKAVNEAYAILSDPEKRELYDRLRRGERMGNPNGAGQARPGDFHELFDYFRSFNPEREAAEGGPKEKKGRPGTTGRDSHLESELTISLEEAARGASKKITLAIETGTKGRVRRKNFEIKIPPGIRDGQRIRLKGQGGRSGLKRSDVYLRIRIAPHPVFSLEGDDLVSEVCVSPWEAALGATLKVRTLGGSFKMKLPPGVRSGQKLRMRAKGFPLKTAGALGDLLYRVMITVPRKLTPTERALFEKLRDVSRFDPRSDR